MAGGSGTRLYPISTEKKPKQFHKIISNETLIEETYNRISDFIDPENIIISSNKKYKKLISMYLPQIPPKNYIIEPIKKNTGPAIALATALIYKRNKNAIIISNHSDHIIVNKNEYKKGILKGIKIVKKNKDNILCIGIKPTKPHTGYGYIEKHEEFHKENNYSIYKTKKFVEKPNIKTAEEYFYSGNFFWNAGYFIWTAETFLKNLKKFSPDIWDKVDKISQYEGKINFLNILNKEFIKMPDISIDHLIMEKTQDLLVLPLDIGWSDVGSWDAVSDLIPQEKRDKDGNYFEGNEIQIENSQTTIISQDNKKTISTIGLKNMIIIITPKAILITPKGRSEDVKKIIKK